MKKLIKQTVTVFMTLLVLGCALKVGYKHLPNTRKTHYVLSDKSLRIINDHDIIIDTTFFREGGSAEYVITRQLMPATIAAKLGEVTGEHKPIKVAFMSHGGSVEIFEAIKDIPFIKNAYIICTIGAAESIAFTYMIHICDERIMLPNAQVMTHTAYYMTPSGSFRDDDTKRVSIIQSDLEAKTLGLDKDVWYQVSRGNGDKYYDIKEMEKYKISTGTIKE